MKQSKTIISFIEQVIEDDRFNPSHISMYVSLIQLWSLNRFQNPFRICREKVMKLAKIKSIATYHKCIRELSDVELIIYLPSYDSYKGSLIEITDFESEETDKNKFLHNPKLLKKAHVPFSVPMIDEVELYFTERDLQAADADQFYSLYRSSNWNLSNNKPMKCWQSAARIWISKAEKVRNKNIHDNQNEY